MKVLLIGTTHAQILSRELQYYGVVSEVVKPSKVPPVLMLKKFDIIYGIYLMSLTRISPFLRLLNKKSVVHIIGSDAVKFAVTSKSFRKKLWNYTLNTCDEILFVSEELKTIMNVKRGMILPIPIDTRLFKKKDEKVEKRDILYYCPNPKIYRLDWILNYAKHHPDETITIIGPFKNLNLSNVEVIPEVHPNQMPSIYHRHRRLVRMTTQDGYPKMPYEALLCGLKVEWNGQEISEVPSELLMENTIPKLISILSDIMQNKH